MLFVCDLLLWTDIEVNYTSTNAMVERFKHVFATKKYSEMQSRQKVKNIAISGGRGDHAPRPPSLACEQLVFYPYHCLLPPHLNHEALAAPTCQAELVMSSQKNTPSPYLTSLPSKDGHTARY